MRPCLLLICAALSTPALAAEPIAAERLAASYDQLQPELEVSGVRRGARSETLVLTEFQVYTADARIVLMTEQGEQDLPLPKAHFYRGHWASDPDSSIFLEVHANGEIRGIGHDHGGHWLLGKDAQGLTLTEAPDSDGGFRCALDHAADMRAPVVQAPAGTSGVAAPAGAVYTARLAIETDNEYLTRFSGNVTNASNYVTTLVGHMSTTYVNQLDTQLQASFVRIWSVTDPYSQTDAACGLLEFGKYWNDNMGATARTTAHMLSGKSSLSGIAWLGVLCQGAFNTGPAQVGATCPGLAASSNYGGAYGFTSGIAGNFNPNAPSIVWDTLGVAHEIGHNFNSPHTHCYGGIGGNASPVDQCYNGEAGNAGCYSGTQQLPGGAGSGTIMSYCHLLSGGLSNVSYTFGRGHNFGVAPVRVPDRMLAHVQTQAAAFPTCFGTPAPTNLIYANGFE